MAFVYCDTLEEFVAASDAYLAGSGDMPLIAYGTTYASDILYLREQLGYKPDMMETARILLQQRQEQEQALSGWVPGALA